jgi:DNA invertase Pin-like site-specific DNA recombinase
LAAFILQANVSDGSRADDDALSRVSPAGPWKADMPPDVQNLRLSFQNQPIDKKGLFRCESLVQNQPMIFGYARVSTDGQSVDAQVKQLRAAGAEKMFKETASGAKTERAELARALRRLDDGDTLLVTRLDRLARSTRDLLNTLAQIAEKGAGFRSLGDAWADTTTPHGRLMLTVLGGLAEFERELIRARTGEGRERAKARGVHMGRPPKLTKHQKKEALKRRDAGEPTREIARMFNVSHSTISRLAT